MTGNPIPRPGRKVLWHLLPASVYRRYTTRHQDERLRVWAQLSEAVPGSRAMLDIDASGGEFACIAQPANAEAPVYALGPTQKYAVRFGRACEEAGIAFVAGAIGGENGAAQCSRHQKRGQTGQAEAHHLQSTAAAAEANSMLGTWTKHESVHPALVKINVEMASPALLQGVPHALLEHPPVTICDPRGEDAERTLRGAQLNEYAARYVDALGLQEQRCPIRPYPWRSRNWLLYPERGGTPDMPSILA